MSLLTEAIDVLHVDDRPEFTELTATFLEQANEDISVSAATSAADGLAMVEKRDVDCIVSDYDMPGLDGLEFLRAIREDFPHLPFILFTNKGSERVASEAISKGVTDYLQKGTSSERYELLCHRIEHAVEKYRAQTNYRELFDQVPVGVTIHDPETGEIIAANHSFADMLGYEPSALEGRHPAELSPEDSPFTHKKADDWIEKALESGQQSFQWQDQTKAGGDIWIEVSLGPATIDSQQRVLAVVHDITTRKERERALTRYETIVESMADPVIVFDTAFRIQYVNTKVTEKTGRTREELLGESFTEVFGPLLATAERGSVSRLKEQLDEMLAGERASVRTEITFADGETDGIGDIRFVPLKIDREIEGIVSIGREITARVRAQEKLREQNDRLEELTSFVSHDLRNPLNVAQTRLELAREECECDHFEPMERAHERMERLIEDLVTFTSERQRATDIEAVALDQLVTQCWETIETADATLTIETDRTLRADRGLLTQLLQNLLRNSVKHGGHAPTVEVGTVPDGFYVADDGPGVPASEREEIVTAGYTTAPDGNGLGLHIVSEIAAAHGWELRVEDARSGGARFVMTGIDRPEEEGS